MWSLLPLDLPVVEYICLFGSYASLSVSWICYVYRRSSTACRTETRRRVAFLLLPTARARALPQVCAPRACVGAWLLKERRIHRRRWQRRGDDDDDDRALPRNKSAHGPPGGRDRPTSDFWALKFMGRAGDDWATSGPTAREKPAAWFHGLGKLSAGHRPQHSDQAKIHSFIGHQATIINQ